MIKKYWFFIGIAAVVFIAFAFPAVGRWVRTFHIINIGIFIAFLLTGLSIETAGHHHPAEKHQSRFCGVYFVTYFLSCCRLLSRPLFFFRLAGFCHRCIDYRSGSGHHRLRNGDDSHRPGQCSVEFVYLRHWKFLLDFNHPDNGQAHPSVQRGVH